MQLWGIPPNSNWCTGGAPNQASGLQLLPFALSFSQLFGRVAFLDSFVSFRILL